MKIILGIAITCVLFFSYVSCDSWDSAANLTNVCPKVQCNNSTNETEASAAARCRCDQQCKTFGDCCADAPTAKDFPPGLTYNSSECDSFPNITSPILLRRTFCTTLSRYTKQCNQSQNFSQQIKNFILKVPVTNPNTGATYGNWYCAFCDGELTYQFWKLFIQCETFNDTISYPKNSVPSSLFRGRKDLKNIIKFNLTLGRWQANETENCTLMPIAPMELQPLLRPCDNTTKYISECPSNVTFNDKCPGYMSAVTDSQGLFYRNEYCAMCNGVDVKSIKCRVPNKDRKKISRGKKPIPMFTLSPSTTLSATPLTTQSTPSSSTTQSTLSSSTTLQPSSTMPPKKPNRRRAFGYLQINADCHTVLSLMNFTKISAETVYYQTMNRSYIRDKKLLDGRHIKVCTPKPGPDSYYVPEASYILDKVILFLAEMLLLVHLIEYVSPKANRNIMHRTLAGYTLALLLANFGILLQDHFGHTTTLYKWLVSLSHYGFLSTFCWMSLMAFEIPCLVVCSLRTSPQGNDQLTRFRMYPMVGCGLPALITGLQVWYEHSRYGIIIGVRPFDENASVVFILLFVVSMSVNLAFYVCSVYVVRLDSTVGTELSKVHGIDFKLHTFLIVLTNTMWASLILNEYFLGLPLLFEVQCLIISLVIYTYSPTQNAFSIRISRYLDKYGLAYGSIDGK